VSTAKTPIKYVSRAKKAEIARAEKAAATPRAYKAQLSNRRPLLIPLTDLKFHPLLKRVAMLPALIERETKLGNAQGKSRAAHKAAAEEMAHDFAALVESISRHGVRERIKVLITPKGRVIVDGRHRYEAAVKVATMSYAEPEREAIARKLATDGIPCEIVSEGDVVPIIMDAVTRRHMSKGARAYLAVLMEPGVATEEKRGGDRSKTAANAVLLTAAELSKRAGVSLRLVEYAVKIFRIFESRGDIRKKFEDAIWVGAGLEKLLAGIEGFMATGKESDEEPETPAEAKARIAQERVETALKVWTSMNTSLKFWDTMPTDGRKEITTRAANAIREAPGEFREALTKALLADSEA
jgi:hypothetical protein